MIIHEGYWNYYLAFRIKDSRTGVFKTIQENRVSGLAAIITDEDTFVSKEVEELMDQRKVEMQHSLEKLTGTESLNELYELYDTNQLPEHFFDLYSPAQDDLLFKEINNHISHVQFICSGFHQSLRYHGKGKSIYYLLFPLKVYFTQRNYSYCPVFIQLFSNGNGIIKTEIPIRNIPSEFFSEPKIHRWFSYVKAWNPLFADNSDHKYKILKHEQNNVLDITNALIRHVEKFFPDNTISVDVFTGFESFVLSKCTSGNLDIIHAGTSNSKLLQQLYYLAFPEDFNLTPSGKKLQKFWTESHFDINGVHVVKGSQIRLIMYANIERMLKKYNRNDVDDKSAYLQSSVSATLDHYISIALMQKENDVLIYDVAERDHHTINEIMRQYYTDANYFDSILIGAPKHGFIFYQEVKKMLDDISVDFHIMLERVQHIEQYEKAKLDEQRNILLNRLTLVFTVLFGLPLINETLEIVKKAINSKSDIVPFITVTHISLIIWFLLVIYMLKDIIKKQGKALIDKFLCFVAKCYVKYFSRKLK